MVKKKKIKFSYKNKKSKIQQEKRILLVKEKQKLTKIKRAKAGRAKLKAFSKGKYKVKSVEQAKEDVRKIKKELKEYKEKRVEKRFKVSKKLSLASEGRVGRLGDVAVAKTLGASDRITGTFSGGTRHEGKGKRAARTKATKGILTAMGVIRGSQQYSGAGRPKGSYKYGMPIQVYNQQLREKKAMFQQYQQTQAMKYKTKGFSPEQVQALQQQKIVSEIPQSRAMLVQERVQEMREPMQLINQRPVANSFGRVIPRSQQVQPAPSVADEELEFRHWAATETISPKTQRMLDTIRRIQNKGKQDNIEQQRRLRERNMVGRSMNLMKAHENMIDVRMDMTGVSEDNILLAPSVFKENPENNILNTQGRPSLLNTRDMGNDLRFGA